MILPDSATPLSHHAIVRYCERALGIDTQPYRDHDDYSVIRNMAGLGYDMAGLANVILSPAVRLAIRAGASAVRAGNIRLIIRGGVIVTCQHRHMRPA